MAPTEPPPASSEVSTTADGESTCEAEVSLTEEEKAVCQQNITSMYIFQVMQAVILGICMGPVFDKYLLTLGGSSHLVPRHARNTLVGFTESVSGVTSMIMAIPVGIMVDRQPERRARLLKLASAFCLLGSITAFFAIILDELIILYVSLILFGAYIELGSSASEAIFADSIPQGDRSDKMVRKAMLAAGASGFGPLLAAGLLAVIGNEWTLFQMKVVLVTGVVLLPFGNLSLFWFRDPPAKLIQKDPPAEAATAESPTTAESSTADVEASTASSEQQPETAVPNQPVRKLGPLRQKHIPFILATSDFVTCIGAGMTVKFFNLFFIEDMGFTPVNVNILQAAYPAVIAGFMKLTKKLADPCGRAQASWAFFSINTLCLLLMSQVTSLPVLLVVFLVRGGFANSTYPIDRSILMDFTPSRQRGCWNAVESFTAMTWTGSAFIGGLLSDHKDYRYTFLITAFIYATACVCYTPLLVLVPRKEKEARSPQLTGSSSGVASTSPSPPSTGRALEVPLMETATGTDTS
mmetsp:Transcript_31129/g.72474  ORF Transcript_31129/g.72474 Transcript_31129/m.72474 type:complete len:523 (+) Transcript_31129:54-1622(+)